MDFNNVNNPVVPLPKPGEGGPVNSGGSNIPVTPLPNLGEGGPAAQKPFNSIITAFPKPILPCRFCNTGRTSNVRFLNATNGYNPFLIYVNATLILNTLGEAEVSAYERISRGYQTITVRGLNGFVFIQKQVLINDSVMTIAINNTDSGLDLTVIADVSCNTPANSSCFRVCNLSYTDNLLDVTLNNGYITFNDVKFQVVTTFSSIRNGRYLVQVLKKVGANSFRTSEVMVSSYINVQVNTLYTLYIFNWNPSPDTIRTLLVEDWNS